MAESATGREALRRESLEGARRLVAVNPERARQEAVRVFHIARHEKHLAQRHRRRSQQKMALFDEFKRQLEAMGIAVVIEPPSGEGRNIP